MAEFLSHPIPAVILLLGVLILVHEFGHFIVAKLCGIGVEIFSIGFGPRLLGFKWNNTDYRLSLIPLGGFVKFVGSSPFEDVPENKQENAFLRATVLKRMAVVFAGPFANFLLAVAAYSCLGFSGIFEPPALIGEILENSPAELAGFRFNDLVKTVNKNLINNWHDLQKIIAESPGKQLDFVVEREKNGEKSDVSLSLIPTATESIDFLDKKVVLGRAGIALGRLPAVISLTNKTDLAAKAGFKTGDKIEEIEVAGKKFKVNFYPELAEVLYNYSLIKSGSILFNIKRPEIEKGEIKKENSLTISLSSSDIWAKLSRLPQLTPRIAARELGFLDSELTILDAKDACAGILKFGDRLLAFNGVQLKDIFQLSELIKEKNAPLAKITVQRTFPSFTVLTKEISLTGHDVQKPSGKATIYALPVVFLGQHVDPEFLVRRYDNPFSAFIFGVKESVTQSIELVVTIGKLITGEFPIKALGGPLLIAKVAGDSVKLGWQAFFNSMALISLNLALINLFPIPILDGGQIILFGAEAVRRRPLSVVAIENFQKIGFVLIVALVVIATYNDFSRFWKSMLDTVKGVFQ